MTVTATLDLSASAKSDYDAALVAYTSEFTFTLTTHCLAKFDTIPTPDLFYALQSPGVFTEAFTIAVNPFCNYGFDSLDIVAGDFPDFLVYTEPTFFIESSDLAALGSYDITISATMNILADILPDYAARGIPLVDTSTFTFNISVVMCEVASFSAVAVVSDQIVTLDDPPTTTNAFLFTAAPCVYEITLTVTYPAELMAALPKLDSYLRFDETALTFEVNFPADDDTWQLIDGVFDIIVTATLEEQLAASVEDYPGDRSVLTASFTWKLSILTPCPNTVLETQELDDVVVLLMHGIAPDLPSRIYIPVFPDSYADRYDYNGIGCGGQSLWITANAGLVSQMSWIERKRSGKYETEDFFTILELGIDDEISGNYDFIVNS